MCIRAVFLWICDVRLHFSTLLEEKMAQNFCFIVNFQNFPVGYLHINILMVFYYQNSYTVYYVAKIRKLKNEKKSRKMIVENVRVRVHLNFGQN